MTGDEINIFDLFEENIDQLVRSRVTIAEKTEARFYPTRLVNLNHLMQDHSNPRLQSILDNFLYHKYVKHPCYYRLEILSEYQARE